MTGTDLYEPLPPRAPGHKRRSVPGGALAAACGALVFGVASFLVWHDDGDRGEPFAVGSIGLRPAAVPPPVDRPSDPPQASSKVATSEPRLDPGGDAVAAGGQQVDVENGVAVIRGTPFRTSEPVTLKVPDPPADKPTFRAPDPGLYEASATGPLPRVGRTGERPSAAYAAPPVATNGRPRIAILVGGMGLDRAATTQADLALPPAVTFGFAPYGSDLAEQVGRARVAGHEIVLQMPMEDFGREDRTLSHMLRVDGSDNADRLHWLMSRFAGYAGAGNYLGGRLLADEGSLKPLLHDIETRGLYFVDDGTAQRSLALPVSKDLGLAVAKADVVIDAARDAASIAAALSRLETLARERGFALGTATGLPATNIAIARFLAEAEKRGIVVTPISQAMSSVGSALAKR